MKKRYIGYWVLLLTVMMGVFSSCYDDKSKSPVWEIATVVIDTTGSGQVMEYLYGTELTLDRKVEKPGVSNPDLSYEWKINLSASTDTSAFYVISTERSFTKVLSNMPSTDPYLLVFTVTDNETGLKYYATWNIRVISGLGEGLIIADTKDDVTSNLSHIQAKGVTANYTGKNVITYDLYSFSNDGNIDGLVNKINYSTAIIQTDAGRVIDNRLYVGTDKSMFTVDPSSFRLTNSGEELFYVAQSSYSPSAMGYGSQNAFYVVIKGKLFILLRASSIGGKFGSAENYIDDSYVVGKYIVTESAANDPRIAYSFYDETNGRFAYKASSMAISSLSVVTGNDIFNGADVKGFECKGAGLGGELDHMYVLQDKTSKGYFLYRLEGGSSVANPKALIDMTPCKEIDQALSFVFCDNQEVMYYVTDKKIYSSIIGNNTISSSEQNVVDLGGNEMITGLQMFYQTNYAMNWDGARGVMSENGMQLILSTYDKVTKEGKIYLLPIPVLNSGKLGAPTNTFRGFGRILAIGTQTR